MQCWRVVLLACMLVFSAPAWVGANDAPGAVSPTLTIPGTGDSQAMLRAMIPLFQARHPGVALVIPHTVGSSGGIKALIDGSAEVARVARPLKDEERSAGLETRLFARSPVVIAANLPAGTRLSLRLDQIVGIYDGSIRDYAQLGGPPGKIYTLTRERGDSCLSVLKRAVPGFKDIEEPVGKVYYTTQEVVRALVGHPGSLCYVPLASIRGTGLAVMAVDSVEPTTENVRSQAYPLAVPLGLTFKGRPSPLARAFLEFLEGPEAGRVMREFGCVPTGPEPGGP